MGAAGVTTLAPGGGGKGRASWASAIDTPSRPPMSAAKVAALNERRSVTNKTSMARAGRVDKLLGRPGRGSKDSWLARGLFPVDAREAAPLGAGQGFEGLAAGPLGKA